MENKDILRNHLDQVHTTKMGKDRIKKNLMLDTDDVVTWCIEKIQDKNCMITRKGKNWYAQIDSYIITINAYSYTIITAHPQKGTTPNA